jgi:inner membrane protein
MPTIGHVAVGMALGRVHADGAGAAAGGWRRVAVVGALALWPDLDMFAHAAGVSHARWYGHRGATHSILAALIAAAVLALWARRDGWAGRYTMVVAALAAVSHCLLDTMSDFGVGPALLWPFSNQRFVSPLRLIPSTTLLARFTTAHGIWITAAEALVSLPLFVYAIRRRSGARMRA